MNIKLHIERLVLDGVTIAPGEHHLVQASVETELTRLLTDGGLSPSLTQWMAVPQISTAGIQLTNTNPTQIGQHIAQSVYGAIGHE